MKQECVPLDRDVWALSDTSSYLTSKLCVFLCHSGFDEFIKSYNNVVRKRYVYQARCPRDWRGIAVIVHAAKFARSNYDRMAHYIHKPVTSTRKPCY
jgi:hypothetical protein